MRQTDAVIGQALFTWTMSPRSGSPGFAYVSVSPSAEDQLTWLGEFAGVLTNYEVAGLVSAARDLYRSELLPVRVCSGNMAAVGVKTYQGKDGRGREGNYSVQLIIGPTTLLPVSIVARLNPSIVIPPESLSVSASPELPDLTSAQILGGETPFGVGLRIAELLERLDANNWLRLDMSQQELLSIPALMGVLGLHWDLTARLEMYGQGDELRWKLLLADSALEHALSDSAPVTGASCSAGDSYWKSLRENFLGARSLAALESSWDLMQSSTRATATDRNRGKRGAFDSFYLAYLKGNGEPLHSALQREQEHSGRLAAAVLNRLLSDGESLVVQGDHIQEINAALLLFGENDWENRSSLAKILPVDSTDLALLAQSWLSPTILREIVGRNSTGMELSGIVLRRVHVASPLWRSIRSLLADDVSREGMVRTLRLSGLSDGGLLSSLTKCTTEERDWAFVFDTILPECFAISECREFLLDHQSEFFDWLGVSDFYSDAVCIARPKAKHWWLLRKT